MGFDSEQCIAIFRAMAGEFAETAQAAVPIEVKGLSQRKRLAKKRHPFIARPP